MRAFRTLLAVMIAALPACSWLDETPPGGTVEPVEEWQGLFNNVSHDGNVYFAGLPTQQGLNVAADDGVKVVVTLLSENEEKQRLTFDEEQTLGAKGVRLVRIPVTPETFSKADVERFAAVLDEAGRDKVLVHCSTSNRVGGLWAAYVQRYRQVSMSEAQGAGFYAGLRSEPMIAAYQRVATEP